MRRGWTRRGSPGCADCSGIIPCHRTHRPGLFGQGPRVLAGLTSRKDKDAAMTVPSKPLAGASVLIVEVLQ